jgi:hypothetical protein
MSCEDELKRNNRRGKMGNAVEEKKDNKVKMRMGWDGLR